jgi:hypothetical protein
MGTFTKELSTYIHAQAEQSAESERQIQHKEDELKKAVSQLKISEVEKATLEKQIAELRRSSKPVAVGSFSLSPSVQLAATALDEVLFTLKSEKKTCKGCGTVFEVHVWDTPVIGSADQCPSCRTGILLSGLCGILGPH